MNIDLLKNILQKHLGDFYNYKENQILFYCPFCNHSKHKLSINLDIGIYQCWVCRESGRIENLIEDKNDRSIIFQLYHKIQNDNKKTEDLITLIEPDLKSNNDLIDIQNQFNDEAYPIVSKSQTMTKDMVLHYLINIRNLELSDIIKYNIHYSLKKEVIFPSYNLNGKLNYFIKRLVNKLLYIKPLMKQEIIFNELFIDWNQDIYITEGTFDLIKIDNNTVPLLTSDISENSILFKKLIKHNKKKFFCLDSDAYKKTINLAEKLAKYSINDMFITDWRLTKYKDYGEFKSKEEVKEFQKDCFKHITKNYLFRNKMITNL